MRASVTGVIKAVTCFIVPIAIIMFMTGINNGGIANINSIIQDVSGSIIGMIPSGMFLLTSVALYQSVIRLSRRKIVVKDLYCIEMLARVNVLCLDKTGTITDGTMRVAEVEELSKIELKHSVKDINGSNRAPRQIRIFQATYGYRDSPVYFAEKTVGGNFR